MDKLVYSCKHLILFFSRGRYSSCTLCFTVFWEHVSEECFDKCCMEAIDEMKAFLFEMPYLHLDIPFQFLLILKRKLLSMIIVRRVA